jgi:hypothetical protein
MAPNCVHDGTQLQARVRPFAYGGVYLGRYEFLACPICSRTYQPMSTAAAIEKAMQAKGLFPLEVRSGSNVLDPVVLEQSLSYPPRAEFDLSEATGTSETTGHTEQRSPYRRVSLTNLALANVAPV